MTNKNPKNHFIRIITITWLLTIGCGGADTINAEMTISDIDTYRAVVLPLYAVNNMFSTAIYNLDESDISEAQKIMSSRPPSLLRMATATISDGTPFIENMNVNETLSCRRGGTATTTGSIMAEMLDVSTIEYTLNLTVDLENCTAEYGFYEDGSEDVLACADEFTVDGQIHYSGKETYALASSGMYAIQAVDSSFSADHVTVDSDAGTVEFAFDIFYDNYNMDDRTYDTTGTFRYNGYEYDIADIEDVASQTTDDQLCNE